MLSPYRLVLILLGLTACLRPARSIVPAPPPAPVGAVQVGALEAAMDLDGRPVGPLARDQSATVAMVFASWCGHCRDEMPVLTELHRRHPEVRVLGVNYRAHEEYDGRGNPAAVRAFVTDRVPWLRVVPADDAVWSSLGSPTKVPTVYVFGRDGTLIRAFDRRTDPIPSLEDLEATLAP